MPPNTISNHSFDLFLIFGDRILLYSQAGLISWFFCFHLHSAEITGVHYKT
jgi:hypothetical protein